MKIKNYLGLFLLVTIYSCESKPTLEAEKVESALSVTEEVKPQTPHDLQLNNNEKWEISKGMKSPVEKMNKLVSKFDGTEVVDYQLLGDDIGKQTSKLIRKCDMTGKAHEELHKWLLPFLDLKEAMVMTSSPEEGEAILEHIKIELKVFDQYFK